MDYPHPSLDFPYSITEVGRASAYMWYQAISLLHQKAQNIEIDGRAHVN
ncbi:MAG: hypothetical protein U5P10_07415 [Spirochaetia bacterium]|nr:hypothetical protein [Spirochaetia bacterium]